MTSDWVASHGHGAPFSTSSGRGLDAVLVHLVFMLDDDELSADNKHSKWQTRMSRRSLGMLGCPTRTDWQGDIQGFLAWHRSAFLQKCSWLGGF